ncbi:MAG: ABC transporter permease, partial [Gammaproteobacteria bacterium]
MMIKLTLLATDALFFGLLIVAACYVWYAANREHLRAPWREVSRHSLGMAAAVVLFAFLVIAVLDSIHFYPRLAAVESANGEAQYAS